MKNILGLDLGSNSIGWAIVKALKNEDGKEILQSIDLAGSRIIPMDQATLGNFENGNSVSQTRERTGYRRIVWDFCQNIILKILINMVNSFLIMR